MGIFESLVGELASKFGLGAKAGPLVAELLRFISNQPDGIAGFIDKVKLAGLGNLVTGWLGRGDSAPPMSGPQVEQVLPETAIKTFASKLGLDSRVITSALAVAIPKVVGLLTPGGTIPTSVPPALSAFLGSNAARLPSTPQVTEKASGGMGKWAIPGLIVLGLLALGWYLLTGKPTDKVATAPAVTAPAVQPRLALSNDAGVVNVSGVVRDEGSRTSILDTLKAAFGAGNVKGDITVDPSASPANWLANLRSAAENFKIPGLQALFDGASVSIGGLIGDADRDRIIASLKSLFGPNVSVAPLIDPVADAVKNAANKTVAALSALKPGFTGKDVVTALNLSIINFSSGSAGVPGFNQVVLQQAAAIIKQLPAGTVIEIGGHTDNTGDPAANMQLSQQRAEAVRQVLVQSGVDPSMLTAKGYGATQPVASNDTPEGRFQNRRIAYSVAQ
ncbi:MAG: OmpA family protein [Rhodospirillales bacterium]|nr:OmpA family protein [Rhodospirillales bacterium]